MSNQDIVRQFLATDPRDVGCDEAMEVLHIYVEAADAELRFPGVAVHLAACGPCSEDFHGLLAAVTRDA